MRDDGGETRTRSGGGHGRRYEASDHAAGAVGAGV